MSKKILIFSTAYLPLIGGAEIAIKEITDRIREIEFDMVTLRFDSKLPKFEKLGNVNVHRIGFTKNNPAPADLAKFPLFLNKLFFPFTAAFAACRLHRKNKYNAIWAMMAAYAGFAALFFKLRHKGSPYLLTLQEGDSIKEIKKKVRLVYPLFKMIFVKADFVQAISSYLAGWARDMGFKGKLEVAPNGVDVKNYELRITNYELRKKLKIGDNEKVIITVSRLVKKNGVGDIIGAMKHLSENAKLLIIGAGELEKNLKFQISNFKLDGRVIMPGSINNENIPQYLALADVFVRPSLSEGQGIAFLEAMAAEVPVIATPVGGIPDFLRDGETGWFCEVKNPHSIAEKIKYVFAESNKEKIRQVVANAKQMVERQYDWGVISLKMKNIFNKLVD